MISFPSGTFAQFSESTGSLVSNTVSLLPVFFMSVNFASLKSAYHLDEFIFKLTNARKRFNTEVKYWLKTQNCIFFQCNSYILCITINWWVFILM